MDLAARSDDGDNNNPMDGFGLFGIVKETGVDDEGLQTFHNDFFTRPLYRNDSLEFYQALGNRKLGLSFLWKMLRSYKSMNTRFGAKKIEGNLIGEGRLMGGVIIFDKTGTPKYAYEEITGNELPIDDIIAALESVKNQN
mmetsp:Transcript_4/g.6  ORF Transcript_4/g.6 Transcript_4/m.6 type:complete len:140 (-) Transcript_4:262-681(-)